MTPHERDRFASLPPCGECEHPAGHHTASRGCWHCDCDEAATDADAATIQATAATGIYATADDYLLTPAALLRMGVRREYVEQITQRCHDAAGLPGLPVLLTDMIDNARG